MCSPLAIRESKNIDIFMDETEKSEQSKYEEFDILNIDCGSSMLYLVSTLLTLLNILYF